MNPWIDVAGAASAFAVGNIVFGHFEYGTPVWRRLLKFAVVVLLTGVISAYAGHLWSALFVAVSAGIGLTAHFVILRKHGIDPWTAEPRDKYYALRGWTR